MVSDADVALKFNILAELPFIVKPDVADPTNKPLPEIVPTVNEPVPRLNVDPVPNARVLIVVVPLNTGYLPELTEFTITEPDVGVTPEHQFPGIEKLVLRLPVHTYTPEPAVLYVNVRELEVTILSV